MYDLVSSVDPAFVSAVFGLARCRRRRGDRRAAVAALDRIPVSSALYVRAQVEAARTLLAVNGSRPGLGDVLTAAGIAEGLPLDEMDRFRLNRDVFQAAIAEVGARRSGTDGGTTILGKTLSERDLRSGLEGTLRAMARFGDDKERVRFIDEGKPYTATNPDLRTACFW